jgi:signal transduction histidine kinase
VSFIANLKFHQRLLQEDLEGELATTAAGFNDLIRDRKVELKDLAWDSAIRKYVTAARNQPLQSFVVSGERPASDKPAPPGDQLQEVRELVAHLLRYGKFYATVAAFSPQKRLLFVAGPPQPKGKGDIEFRTEDLLPHQIQPDDNVWTDSGDEPSCAVVSEAMRGKTLRCTMSILVWEKDAQSRGALVADINIDSLVAPVARRWELTLFGNNTARPAMVMVLDESGEIVYHSNDALKHQEVRNSMPYFVAVANSMTAGQSGMQYYEQSNGDKWMAAYTPLSPTKLSLAVTRNYSLASRDARRYGWIGIALALLVGSTAAVFLTSYYQRRTKSIDRVAAGVGEIAKGKLDHRIELRSSDDLRPLADNVGLVTKQLRDQIAREAEGRQFQSFVRLSAVLTHDLKNAIEALSLIVNNMEQHYEKEEFRADAMQSLTAATDKLRALVARLSNPVNTLSGEHKRPRPVDLVPILKRVIAMTVDPARSQHEIRINLPETLFALVDGDRMDKVMENLIINALEAMGQKRGTLTIDAGETEAGKPFFSVSDTGDGINERFIAERLFHPFATTKRKGVGLGLYTCREVINANGGTIEVESQVGAGTTFRVVLPSAPIENAVNIPA